MSTSTSPSNELLREQLRGFMERESGGDDDDDDDRGEGKSKGRKYRITVRGEEVFRYTLPDFFPDFNPTPLVRTQPIGRHER